MLRAAIPLAWLWGALIFFGQKAQLIEIMHMYPAHWRLAGGVCTPHGRALAAPGVIWGVDHVFLYRKARQLARWGDADGVESSS